VLVDTLKLLLSDPIIQADFVDDLPVNVMIT
jgi:hypothetical protein